MSRSSSRAGSPEASENDTFSFPRAGCGQLPRKASLAGPGTTTRVSPAYWMPPPDIGVVERATLQLDEQGVGPRARWPRELETERVAVVHDVGRRPQPGDQRPHERYRSVDRGAVMTDPRHHGRASVISLQDPQVF